MITGGQGALCVHRNVCGLERHTSHRASLRIVLASCRPAMCSHVIQSIPTTVRQGDQLYGKRSLSPEGIGNVSRVSRPANGRAGNWGQASFYAATSSCNTTAGFAFSLQACFESATGVSEEPPAVPGPQVVHPELSHPWSVLGLRGGNGPHENGPRSLALSSHQQDVGPEQTSAGPQRGQNSSSATSPHPCFTRP